MVQCLEVPFVEKEGTKNMQRSVPHFHTHPHTAWPHQVLGYLPFSLLTSYLPFIPALCGYYSTKLKSPSAETTDLICSWDGLSILTARNTARWDGAQFISLCFLFKWAAWQSWPSLRYVYLLSFSKWWIKILDVGHSALCRAEDFSTFKILNLVCALRRRFQFSARSFH